MTAKTDWARWSRARELAEEAEQLALDERAPFLDRETEGEEQLRSMVDRLLAAEVEDDFLQPPSVPGAARQRSPDEAPGTRIESYELRRLIARGGMGAVYEAEQSHPHRRVALKTMPPDAPDGTRAQRFRDEIDFLARLQHPGIAAIYEAGVLARDGEEVPWFSMELVEGARPLTLYVKEEGLALEQRLVLLLELCSAVAHGHQRGVLHRDLKPANVLVDRAGRLKVIDFGVAKATDAGGAVTGERTLEGEIVGTLLYMSPEQIEGRQDEVDTRADVYALGVVLYELLCDQRPYEIEGMSITRAGRILCEEEAPPPSYRARNVPRDLDWVCARAMAKERDRRYGTVAGLAADVERFLAHEPVRAGPPSTVYQVRKFVRRHRVGVTALTVALVGVTVGLLRARSAEAEAKLDRQIAVDNARTSAAVVDYLVDFLASPDPGRDGRDARVVESLERAQASYTERFAEAPEVQVLIAEALGRVYQGLGLPEESEAELRRALEVQEALGAESDRDRIRMLGHLGSVLMLAGRLEESESMLQEALDASELLGDGDPTARGRARIELGRLRLAQRERAEAIELLSSGIADLANALGPDDRDVLIAKNALAGALHESGELDRAEPIYREALEGLEDSLGAEHPDTLRLRFNHAMLLHSKGEAAEAIRIFEDQLVVRRRVYGPDHPETLSVITNLAGMLGLAGRLEEAVPLYEEGLEKMEAVLPPGHRALQALRINFASLEKSRADYERAESLLSAVYEQRLQDHGATAEATLQVLYAATKLSRERGWLDEARERAELGLEGAREGLGAEHAFFYQYECELGRILTALGEYEEAEEVLLRSRDSFAAAVARGAELASPDDDLAALYEAWGVPGEAAKDEVVPDAR